MPSYPHDRYYNKDGYELAHHIGRDLRQSHRPTRYIINEGKLIIDERSFEDRDRSGSGSGGSRPNTIIYNAPGSTMWIEPQLHREDRSHRSECRRCLRWSDRYYDGYCAECVARRRRLDSPRRHEVVTVHDRRLLEYPERRAIQWR
ncbi:hypothetical protein F5Y14DRAFT_272547 [Nemania sp. NC0429]|nr:hypothetical protein F5Y14DRAFT_272547 [Nemania sp. NC0429]